MCCLLLILESCVICGPIETYILVNQFQYVHLPIKKHKNPNTFVLNFSKIKIGHQVVWLTELCPIIVESLGLIYLTITISVIKLWEASVSNPKNPLLKLKKKHQLFCSCAEKEKNIIRKHHRQTYKRDEKNKHYCWQLRRKRLSFPTRLKWFEWLAVGLTKILHKP